MSNIYLSLGLVILPYLLGSIATAIWVSRGLYGVDIRTQGSKNAGSTNMFRMLGFKAGIITQVVDIGKGTLAALLPVIVLSVWPEEKHWMSGWDMEMQKLACGLIAVFGHIYPVFERFKGGKGINTLLGMMLAVNPLAALVCLVVWVAVLFVTRYVAVASMLGVGSYPVFVALSAVFSGNPVNGSLVILGTGMFALVVFTHRSNVQRLIAGTEDKNTWFDRKSKKA